MSLSRRCFVVGSLAALAAGCAERTTSMAHRPGPSWPAMEQRPYATQPGRVVLPPAPAPAAVTPSTSQLNAISRSRWAKAQPITSRLEPMGGINRLTIHHEGYKTVWFDDYATTMARIDLIRQSHINRMRAGDIGYHYIIDRAGRVWEGRPVQYQGAHAGGANNKNNIGIMVLGNFDNQSPSDAQFSSLMSTVRTLRTQYRVPTNRVYTHQELSPTRCPGTHLQPRIASLRSNGRFG